MALADTLPGTTTSSNLLSIAELHDTLTNSGRAVQSFRVEGVVCAIVPQRNMVVLQDASASVLLELPSVSRTVRVGDWLAVEGDHCPLTRTRYGIQAGVAPVVDNDGTHGVIEKIRHCFFEHGNESNPRRVV